MQNRNAQALFITFCIAILLAWVAWGRTTEHIWSAWLFLVLFLVALIIIISLLISQLRSSILQNNVLANVIGIVIYGGVVYSICSDINIQSLTILDYLFSGFLLILLIFTGVRFVGQQT